MFFTSFLPVFLPTTMSSWRKPISMFSFQHAADYAFCDLVFAKYGEPVLRLPVQRLLEDVAVKRYALDLSGLLIAV